MELVEHQYTEGDSITELVAFFHTKNAQLAGMNKDFDRETLAFLILHSLPKTQEWKNVISNIVQSQSSGSSLMVSIVEARLLQIERLQHGQEYNSALATTHTKLTQTSTPTSTSTTATSPNKGRCQNCHKGFHTTENCRAPGGAKEGIPYPDWEKKQGTATAVITWEKPSHLFLAYATRVDNLNMDLNTLLTSYSTLDHLVLDSGCSIHMSPHEDWFIPGTLKKLQHSHSIHVTNGQELNATMSSTLQANCHDPCQVVLHVTPVTLL